MNHETDSDRVERLKVNKDNNCFPDPKLENDLIRGRSLGDREIKEACNCVSDVTFECNQSGRSRRVSGVGIINVCEGSKEIDGKARIER
jgi:hypothetical protein